MNSALEDARAFERCIGAEGVVLFPSDTVYGLAVAAGSESAVKRLYRIKQRVAQKPAAVMFFRLHSALAVLDELGERTRAGLERLLPGPVTLILPNPYERFPLACGPTRDRLGLRVPKLAGASEVLAGVSAPVLQSSANLSGSGEARRLTDVDPAIRAAVDLELDGGELPGTASTVVDLGSYEDSGEYRILRAGALPEPEVAAALGHRQR